MTTPLLHFSGARRIAIACALATIVTTVAACGGDSSTLTYYADAKAIVDARCATCHRDGDIAPFPLTTYEEVQAFAVPVRSAIENGTMPPWQPDDECNTYLDSIDLTADEKATLLAWLDADAPAGDPSDAPAGETAAPPAEFAADISLQLPEPYTPTREPDDYRCQLIPWPADDTRFVTGLRVTPDQKAIVHHVIVFAVGPGEVEQYRAYDEAEAGPGYTCYGGPRANDGNGGLGDVDPAELLAALERLGISLEDLRSGNVTPEQIAALMDELGVSMSAGNSLGSWVPGVPANPLPEGTGIRMEPGSMLVAQFHYNTLSSAPVADQSTIEIATAASVEREATNMPFLDIGWVTNGLFGDPMTIPAGDPEVSHSTLVEYDSMFLAQSRARLGLAADAPLVIHNANHHMHELGTRQRTEIRHDDGSTTCVLDIPDWDFAWQGSYRLAEPIAMRPGDTLWMGCTWDNSAANQPVVNGEAREPVDVAWGEGTSDEMCLGSFYVTAE